LVIRQHWLDQSPGLVAQPEMTTVYC
jgi:hypothetical protein